MANVFQALGHALGKAAGFANDAVMTAHYGEDWKNRADQLARLNEIQVEGEQQEVINRKMLAESAAADRKLAKITGLVNMAANIEGDLPPEVADLYGHDTVKGAAPLIAGMKAKRDRDRQDKINEDYVVLTQDTDLGPGGKYKKGDRVPKAQFTMSGQNWRDYTQPPNGRNANGLTPTAEASLITSLAKQWETAQKPAAEMSRQINLMRDGMKQAKFGNIGAGSQEVLVTFQKVLDPPSVVRESEYARSPEGLALKAKIQGMYEKVQFGGVGMPVEELQKYADAAESAAAAFFGSGYLESRKRRIGAAADHYSLPHETIFNDFDFGADFRGEPQPGAGGAPPAGGGQHRIGEKKDFGNGLVGVWDGKGWKKEKSGI